MPPGRKGRPKSVEFLAGNLHTQLSDWPDAPIRDFDKTISKISSTDSVAELSRLNDWIDRQQVCSVIVKHHGYDALERVLKTIAQACVRVDAPMGSRVQSVASFYELDQ